MQIKYTYALFIFLTHWTLMFVALLFSRIIALKFISLFSFVFFFLISLKQKESSVSGFYSKHHEEISECETDPREK